MCENMHRDKQRNLNPYSLIQCNYRDQKALYYTLTTNLI